jgi:hypothetical protein
MARVWAQKEIKMSERHGLARVVRVREEGMQVCETRQKHRLAEGPKRVARGS